MGVRFGHLLNKEETDNEIKK